MKFIFFLFITVIPTKVSVGQITKNNWMVGGSFNYTRSKPAHPFGNEKRRSIDIGSGIGYFIIDKLAIGVQSRFLFTKQWFFTPNNIAIYDYIGAGPFLRYYFLPAENKINLFSQAVYLYNTNMVQNNGSSNNYNHDFSYSISSGIVFFVNSSIGVELTAAYNHYEGIGYDARENNIKLNLGFQIHLEKENK